ncbi:amidohydrolase family protein [Geodermatophilus sp. SYSU D00705]
MPAVDLSDVPVVDGHCHGVERRPDPDPAAWRGRFTESPDPAVRARDARHTAFSGRLLRAMAAFHGVPPDEDAVLEARSRLDTGQLVARLFADAGIGGVVVDTGFPSPDSVLSGEAFDACSGAHRVSLLRLEVLFQELVAAHARYPVLVDAVRAATADVRAAGYAGLKSIAAYRTGLAIQRWPEDDARAAFRAAREEVAATGAVRLGHQPLLDTLLHLALAAAAAQELPVQFHVGYGDPDVDLRRASPLQLRAVLEEPAYRPVPVVLLHGCWPYVREGAFLASVYGNAHLDLSYAIPFLSTGELRAMTRAALGAAPFSKLTYSSDGTGVPELHWLGARTGRAVLGAVLGELVADGDLFADQARRAGERVLRDNACALYGLPPRTRPRRVAGPT